MSWAFALISLAFVWGFLTLLSEIGERWKTLVSLRSKNRLPPGPRGLPILGNLLVLGNFPHQTLCSLAKEYGPIMYLRLGLVPTIVVSSPQAAKEFLQTHDAICSGRPAMEAAKYMLYNSKDIVFSSCNSHWRMSRKFCTSQLLSNPKIDEFKSMRKEELSLVVKSLREIANARGIANLSSAVTRLTVNMICMMVFHRKYMDESLDDRGLKTIVQDVLNMTGAFNVADYIPFLRPFDPQRLRPRMKLLSKIFDEFLEDVIDKKVANRDSHHQMDFVDVMLADPEFQKDRTVIKAVTQDMLIGGTGTSAITVEWGLSELLRHPRVMKKLQQELETVVGMNRMVEETDLPKLKYLHMVIKEIFRLHPSGPLLIPHESTEDCTINGFYIPKKSRIIINIYSIGRDPTVWTKAEEFIPERFVGSNMDVLGRDFELITFGSGRRICPGMQLGLRVVQLLLAQLVHCFDWKLPMLPSELDMTEKFGLTMPRANPLFAIPTYRLRSDLI